MTDKTETGATVSRNIPFHRPSIGTAERDQWLADADTPVSVFAKLGRGPYSFLLESVVGGEKWAAYSFAGVRPRAVYRAKGKNVEVLMPDGLDMRVTERVQVDNPLEYLSNALASLPAAVPPGLPARLGR